jgi:hypothetical protein
MNARTLLIGIGIVAVVTGGVLGSGALTQVTAERTATVETTGDASAAIGLSAADVDSTINATSYNSGELEISFDNINQNAVTTTTAFVVDNNLNSGVGIQVISNADWLSVVNVEDGSDSSAYTSLSADGQSGDSVTVKLEIDTTHSDFSSGASPTITVEADSGA